MKMECIMFDDQRHSANLNSYRAISYIQYSINKLACTALKMLEGKNVRSLMLT